MSFQPRQGIATGDDGIAAAAGLAARACCSGSGSGGRRREGATATRARPAAVRPSQLERHRSPPAAARTRGGEPGDADSRRQTGGAGGRHECASFNRKPRAEVSVRSTRDRFNAMSQIAAIRSRPSLPADSGLNTARARGHPRRGPRTRGKRALFLCLLRSATGRGQISASNDAETHRHPIDPDHRRRPDRHRPGLRVRLFRHPGLQGAEGRGLPDRAGQLQSGDDHDRSGSRRRHLYRADHARRSSPRSSRRSGPRSRCCRPWAGRPRSTPRCRCAAWACSTSSASR